LTDGPALLAPVIQSAHSWQAGWSRLCLAQLERLDQSEHHGDDQN
jgi:hypothetical protein